MVSQYTLTSLCLFNEARDLECNELELMWLEVHEGRQKCLLGCNYRPPSAPASTWEALDQCLQRAISVSADLVLVGDFKATFLPNISIEKFCQSAKRIVGVSLGCSCARCVRDYCIIQTMYSTA